MRARVRCSVSCCSSSSSSCLPTRAPAVGVDVWDAFPSRFPGPACMVAAGRRAALVVVALVAAGLVVADLAVSVAAGDSAEVVVAQTGKGSGARSTLSLDDLVSQLRAVHGTSLAAVVLYGSAATNEHVEGLSDVNVMVLVES